MKNISCSANVCEYPTMIHVYLSCILSIFNVVLSTYMYVYKMTYIRVYFDDFFSAENKPKVYIQKFIFKNKFIVLII